MPMPRKRRCTTQDVAEDAFGSGDEDRGSGFESALSDAEEMFSNAMDPVLDDPTLAQAEGSESLIAKECPDAVNSESNEKNKFFEESKSWKDLDEEDSDLFHHKFLPARNPGSLLKDRKYSPLELFQLFFSMETIASLCNNTNKNAKIKKEKGKKYKWEPVETGEFMKFCGILVYMGIIRCPRIQDYWRSDNVWQTPFVRKVMGRERFQAISWSFHISDPDTDSENNTKKGTEGYDKLAKIRPLMESIKLSCKAFYHPRRRLSIDERMVPTMVKNGMKMFLKFQPNKWGYKLFVLCDSETGYTCDLQVYTSSDVYSTSNGLSYDSVMSLVNPSFLGTGYVLYCDSFFTSPALFRDLYEMKIGACGTVRENRSGFPRTQENALTKTSERGSMRWIRQGPLLFVKWQDTQVVSMCSTIHKAFAGNVITRRLRQPDGTWKPCEIPLPAPVKSFNKYMGGVDLSDQRLQSYTNYRTNYKWYKTFFFHFLDMAVANTYLLYKEQCETKSLKTMTYLDFKRRLCAELCDVKMKILVPPVVPLEHEIERLKGGRRVCKQCKVEGRRSDTSWQCGRCEVPLCGSAARNCFRNWHLPDHLKKKVDPPCRPQRFISHLRSKCSEVTVTID
ncbi:piggyBac transposable element-derived protein 4-like [Hoplias malabaricus]|uniref:piggyBac transposable element-derived protein 4-like n=1 Tax=Hoplias malabaricus TaxID=27720 RepID=UPI003461B70A